MKRGQKVGKGREMMRYRSSLAQGSQKTPGGLKSTVASPVAQREGGNVADRVDELQGVDGWFAGPDTPKR